MTIKELSETLRPYTHLQICCNGYDYDIDPDVNSPIFQSVSNYVVDKIDATDKDCIKADILVIPVKAE